MIKLIGKIEKTQNRLGLGINKRGENEYKILEGDFFYDNKSFIGKKVEVTLTKNSLVSHISCGIKNFYLESLIIEAIQNKKKKLSKYTYGILIRYEIISSEMDENKLVITAEITQCEADCG